ncbi:MAG TPA: tetratricopeptide repeat protein, partial [Myxococcus sp.]|nr:tetratricopeptide repeat protein [Myxococcus sp.]
GPGRVLLAALVWLGGLLLKETALVMPVLLWAAALATGDLSAAGAGRAWARRVAPLALALGPYAVLRVAALGLRGPAALSGAGGFQVLEVLALVGELGGKLFWPVPLFAVPPSGPVASALEPRVLLGAALVLGLGALLVAARRRPGRDAVWAGALWLVVPLLPVLLLRLKGVEAYAERYLYLPSVGFVLLVAAGLRGGLERWPGHARAMALATGGVLAVSAALTVASVPMWRDDQTLWEAMAEAVPGRPLIHARLGSVYLKSRRLEDAVRELEVAVAGLPGDFRIRSDLAVAYARTGRLEEALQQLEAAVRLRPDNAMAWHNLGLALRRAGRPEQALERFQQALRLAPGRADSHLELGRTLLALGRSAEAVGPLKEALRLRPGFEAAERALASARAGGTRPPAP